MKNFIARVVTIWNAPTVIADLTERIELLTTSKASIVEQAIAKLEDRMDDVERIAEAEVGVLERRLEKLEDDHVDIKFAMATVRRLDALEVGTK